MTSLLVALLGQARVYVVLGRARLMPSWLATVHPTRETPLNAAVFTGVTSGAPNPHHLQHMYDPCHSLPVNPGR